MIKLLKHLQANKSAFKFYFILVLLISFSLVVQAQPSELSPSCTKEELTLDTSRSKLKRILLPAISFNKYDGVIGGVLLMNDPEKDAGLGYMLNPGFGFGSKRPVGAFRLSYKKKPLNDDRWKFFYFGLEGKSYSFYKNDVYKTKDYYYKLAPEVAGYQEKSTGDQVRTRRFSYRFVYIYQDFIEGIDRVNFERKTNSYYVNVLRFEQNNCREYNASKSIAWVQQGNNFVYLFGRREQMYIYDAHHAVVWHISGSWLPFNKTEIDDAFVGLMPNGTVGLGRFQPDYTFDQSLIGRSEQSGIWSQQIYQKGAGLRTVAGNFDLINDWMIGLGVEAELPVKLPLNFELKAYVDAAIYPSQIISRVRGVWTSGIELALIPDFLSVYFPLLESVIIREKYITDQHNSYLDRIGFSLSIHLTDQVVSGFFN